MEEIPLRMPVLAAFSCLALSVLPQACRAAADGATRLILAEDGSARAVVVVAPKATAPEKHAASELAAFLGQVTGAAFEVVDEPAPGRACLFVGPDATAWAEPEVRPDGLGGEEIVVRSVDNGMVLTGGRPRGTLYAVYTFLEDVVGCRWWTPAVSSIPRRRDLSLDGLDIRYSPTFEFREPYWGHTGDGDWCARNRLNGARTKLDRARGGKYAEIGGVHSFNRYMSPDRYFEEHPEWFSEIDGKRTRSSTQLCFTNRDMLRELTRNVVADVRAHWDATSVWVSQNDWGNHCQCARCRELEEREGSPSGGLIHLVNHVAAELAKEFPNTAVSTLAYDWSQKPPKNLRPLPNVIIWLCTTQTSYAHPYTHERNRDFQQNLEAWARICDRIYIWDYVTNFAAFLCPHPNLRTLGPNVTNFAEHNVKGVFSLGAYGAPGAEMAELRAWVTAKLFWDASRDANGLIDEFLTGFYGPAAVEVKAYLDVFHDAAEAAEQTLGMCQQPTTSRFLTLDTLTRGLAHLRAAKAAATGNQEALRRLDVAELPLLYVFLVRWDELKHGATTSGTAWPIEPDIRTVYDRLLAVMETNGVTRFSEKNARDWFPTVRERVAVGDVTPPPGCEDIPRHHWADLQNIGFVANGETADPPLAKRVVDDPQASTGTAAWMPGGHGKKGLLRELWRIPLVTVAADAGKRLRCRLSVRCRLTGKDGVAFRCGIDGREPVLEVEAATVEDGRYHTYEVGVFDDLRGWINLWLTPGNNEANVEGIWVDRAWLVMEE